MLADDKTFSGVEQTFTYAGDSKVKRHIYVNGEEYSETVSLLKNTGDPEVDYFRAVLDEKEWPSRYNERKRRLTYIDLFCGGGGLSLGVQQAANLFGRSPRCLTAVDLDDAALKLTKAHFKPLISRSELVEDLIKYHVEIGGAAPEFLTEPSILDPQISQFKGKVDLLVGGPPCQGHSTLNNKTRGFDPRNLLYYIMPAFGVALDVNSILIENVRNISSASEKVVENTRKILEHHGYWTQEVVIDASKYGVAQTRSRHFLVASKGEPVDLDAFIQAFEIKPLSFASVNSDLTMLENGSDVACSATELSAENKNRVSHLHDNELYELPNSQRPDCHKDGHTYPSVYGRIKPDEPMGTITTGFSSPGRGRYVHPFERRVVNVREAGRIQSFPDWYWASLAQLGLSKNNMTKIIGDAVPAQMVVPLLASILTSK